MPGAGECLPHRQPVLRPPAACCFDFDGLLVDTAALWARAFAEACGAAGRLPPQLAAAELLGASVHDAAATLSRHLGVEVDPALVLRALIDAFRACPPSAQPGVQELVPNAARRCRLLVVTNGPHELVEATLDRLALAQHFEAIVSAGSVARPKPAPDVYLAACEVAGVAPAQAVALEDSSMGVTSAHCAGLRVIGVSSTTSLSADLLVRRLDDPRVLVFLGIS